MSDLFEKSMATLELPRVLELLSGCAVTDEGRERARALRPMDDIDDVKRAQAETTAAVKLLVLRGTPGFAGIRPVAASLQRADMGGSLNTRELLEIAAVLRAARTASDYGAGEEKTPISHLFRALTTNRFLEDTITNSIVGEDELADSASPELASIRRHMRATESKVRDILQKLISSNQSKYLQESIITIRSDRYVVPVKSEHKNAIPGLVHDVSSSGSTFFIEPMGVVKANNELRELLAKEKKEIERILAELSAQCAAHKEDIAEDYQLLIWLDAIFARAKLSVKLECTEPKLSDKYLHLRGARHPLLDPKKAVANDLELGERFDTLVITGPNTGGKTVTLKTLGLITLMAQCGLHVPAKDDSTVRVYARVLADIGDEQSIAQSLSTFSSHMTNIVGILGVKMASQPPDKAHPYGHAKFETYASLAIGVMLAVAAYNLAADGIQALLGHRSAVEVNGGSYVVMVGTLVINLAVSFVEGRFGKRLASEVLTADALHTRSDAFVTISVILGLVAVSLGYPMADSLVAVIVSVAIAISAVEVFREAARTLSDHAVLEVEPLRQAACQVPGVRSVHHIRTRGTEGDVFVDLHLLVDPTMTVARAHQIAQEVEQAVQQGFPEVSDVMVHIEPDNPQERSEGLADDRALGVASKDSSTDDAASLPAEKGDPSCQ